MPDRFDPVARKARFRGGILGFMAAKSLGFAFVLWTFMGGLQDYDRSAYLQYREFLDAFVIGFVVGGAILGVAALVAYFGTHAVND